MVDCGFDRFLADDPIVLPGRPGESHLHQFFGAVGVTAGSTHDDLPAGSTTCDQRADTASYWAPALIDADGEPIEPLRAVAYYRAGPDVDPVTVVPFPPGLMMVAGDHTATEPHPVAVVGWSCGSGGVPITEPPECGPADHLRLRATFPDRWNGADVRSPIAAEPNLHVSYSREGRCPDGHPVPIPQLQLVIEWPAVRDPSGLALSSGDIHSGHADFWNVWDQAELRREVVACLHRDLVCNVGT